MGNNVSDDKPKPRVSKEPNPRYSRSLEYGVAILECFSSERRELGIADLADLVGLSRSTTHRYAVTLVTLGYLEQNAKRKYRLAARAGTPGAASISAVRQSVRALAVLKELRDGTGYTVSMGVLDRARVVYVYRLFGHRLGQYAIDRDLGVGANVPLYCTALGKVLLASVSEAERRELLAGLNLITHGPRTILNRDQLAAELERISLREAVISDEEFVGGARSIAVLVPQSHGELPLAIEATVPSSAYTVAQLVKEIAPRLKRAAQLIAGN
jgi:IclR family pca regulon transcriptional regulator